MEREERRKREKGAGKKILGRIPVGCEKAETSRETGDEPRSVQYRKTAANSIISRDRRFGEKKERRARNKGMKTETNS